MPAAPLPIEGCVELDMPVDRLWEIFLDVRRWPEWNPCLWRSRVRGGELRIGATLLLAFNPIRPRYPYKLPAAATIVELERHDRVTWEAGVPGFPRPAQLPVRRLRSSSSFRLRRGRVSGYRFHPARIVGSRPILRRP